MGTGDTRHGQLTARQAIAQPDYPGQVLLGIGGCNGFVVGGPAPAQGVRSQRTACLQPGQQNGADAGAAGIHFSSTDKSAFTTFSGVMANSAMHTPMA